MKIRFFIHILLLIVLSSISELSEAKFVPGYIINDKSDTIYGDIKLYRFNLGTGGLVINGINLDRFHMEVWFRGKLDNRFHSYSPEMISGFSFQYQETDYIFRSFMLNANSIINSDRIKYRFLNLIYGGKVSLYKDITIVYAGNNLSDDLNYTYYDYYLFNKLTGFNKLVVSDSIKNLNDLLYQYNFEKDFMTQLPDNLMFKQIIIVLEKYDTWSNVVAL